MIFFFLKLLNNKYCQKMGNQLACQQVAGNLRNFLESSDELKNNGVGVPNSTNNSHCFKVSLPFPYPSNYISVSVPPNAYGNRGDEYGEGVPSTYETALFNNGELVYNDDVGYEDICRFESNEDLVEELVRLSRLYPEKCKEVAENFRRELLNSSIISELDGHKVQTFKCLSTSFLVELSLGYPSSHVSISVPLDTNLNAEKNGYVYEFALSDGNKLLYDDTIGYGDVIRFSTTSEGIGEFFRLNEIGRVKLTNVISNFLVNDISSLCVEYT